MKRAYQMIAPVALALVSACSILPKAEPLQVYLLPSQNALALKSTRLFERAGRIFGPTLAGALVVQARKELFPAIPRRKKAERYVRLPAMSPQTAMELPER